MLNACSVAAPKYSPSYENVQILKRASSKVEINDFTGPATSGSISLRGTSLVSPYGKDMIHYIQVAIEGEFEKAGLLLRNSPRKLSAVIEENYVDISGFTTGNGKIVVAVSISNGDVVLYKKKVKTTMEWGSSFLGGIAIPLGAESYPKLVKGLLHELYADADFIAALTG